MKRPLSIRSAAVLLLGVLVPLALVPILAAVRAPWTGTSLLPTPVFVLLSAIGGGTGLVAIKSATVYALVRRRRGWDVAFFVLAVADAHIAGRLLKNVFDAARPAAVESSAPNLAGISEVGLLGVMAALVAVGFFTRWRRPTLLTGGILVAMLALEAGLDFLVPLVHGMDSFPSGHAVASMAFVASVGVVAWNTRRLQMTVVAGALFVLGVGASRVYLGVHYPADVIGGWCVAVASVAGTWLVVRAVQDRTVGPRPGLLGTCDRSRQPGLGPPA